MEIFVYKNQIITGSLYLVGEERVDETIRGGFRGGYLENYLSEVLKQVSWYPESVYTIDICESEGELYSGSQKSEVCPMPTDAYALCPRRLMPSRISSF